MALLLKHLLVSVRILLSLSNDYIYMILENQPLGTVLRNKPFVGIKLKSKMLLDNA